MKEYTEPESEFDLTEDWQRGLSYPLSVTVTAPLTFCSMTFSVADLPGLNASCSIPSVKAGMDSSQPLYSEQFIWHAAMPESSTAAKRKTMPRKLLNICRFSEKRRKYTSKNQNPVPICTGYFPAPFSRSAFHRRNVSRGGIIRTAGLSCIL